MEFTIEKNTLLKNLKFCNEIISGININPVLSGVLFKVKNNQIELICSCQNISAKINITKGFTIKSEGNSLIKCRILFNIISKINENEITFNLIDNSVLRISTKNFISDLNILEEFSYPNINFEHTDWELINLDSVFFNKCCQKLSNSVLQSLDQTNILSGILFDSQRLENYIEVISTDSFHLSYLKHSYTGNKFKIVLNIETIKLINSLTQEKKENINIYVNKKQVIFKINNIVILCRVLDGEYPSAIKAIETIHKYKFLINKKDLLNSIDIGSVLISNEKKPSLQFEIKQNILKVSFKSIDNGSSCEEKTISEYDGPQTSICLNTKFLTDLIKSIDSEDILFNFTDGLKPIILKDQKDEEFISLILPIRNL